MSVPSPQALMLQMSNEVPGILIFRDCYTSFQTHWNQGKSMPSSFVTMQSPSYEGIDEATCVLSDTACHILFAQEKDEEDSSASMEAEEPMKVHKQIRKGSK